MARRELALLVKHEGMRSSMRNTGLNRSSVKLLDIEKQHNHLIQTIQQVLIIQQENDFWTNMPTEPKIIPSQFRIVMLYCTSSDFLHSTGLRCIRCQYCKAQHTIRSTLVCLASLRRPLSGLLLFGLLCGLSVGSVTQGKRLQQGGLDLIGYCTRP